MTRRWYKVPGFLLEITRRGEARSSVTKHHFSLPVDNVGYIRVFCRTDKNKPSYIRLHRALAITFLGHPRGKEVNHVNGITTDNRLKNLQWITRAEHGLHTRWVLGRNIHNRRGRPLGRIKGTRKYPTGWIAEINSNGKHIHLGVFPTQRQAALAYDRGAKIYHDCPVLNFPEVAR